MRFADLSSTNFELMNPMFSRRDRLDIEECITSSNIDKCLQSKFWDEFSIGFLDSLLSKDITSVNLSQQTRECASTSVSIKEFLRCPHIASKPEKVKGYITATVLRQKLISNIVDFESPLTFINSYSKKHKSPLFNKLRW